MKNLLRALVMLGQLSACGVTNCVARGSRVRVPGGTRRIEELSIGDEVLCAEPASGVTHVTRVTAVRRSRRECVRLDRLTLTWDHPVYCPTDGSWSPAGEWITGTRSEVLVVGPERAEVTNVVEREAAAGEHEVFDLSVEHPLHNFIAEGVLVHNKENGCLISDAGDQEGAACLCADGGTGKAHCDTQHAPAPYVCDC
jgi:hypothetical protein